jgi:hypothetical protein
MSTAWSFIIFKGVSVIHLIVLEYEHSECLYLTELNCRVSINEVGFEVITAASVKMAIFWVVALCACCLWNIGKFLPDYTVLQPRRQPSKYQLTSGTTWLAILLTVLPLEKLATISSAFYLWNYKWDPIV